MHQPHRHQLLLSPAAISEIEMIVMWHNLKWLPLHTPFFCTVLRAWIVHYITVLYTSQHEHTLRSYALKKVFSKYDIWNMEACLSSSGAFKGCLQHSLHDLFATKRQLTSYGIQCDPKSDWKTLLIGGWHSGWFQNWILMWPQRPGKATWGHLQVKSNKHPGWGSVHPWKSLQHTHTHTLTLTLIELNRVCPHPTTSASTRVVCMHRARWLLCMTFACSRPCIPVGHVLHTDQQEKGDVEHADVRSPPHTKQGGHVELLAEF